MNELNENVFAPTPDTCQACGGELDSLGVCGCCEPEDIFKDLYDTDFFKP